MPKWIVTCLLILLQHPIFAQNRSGVYSYNKGLNKANASLYISHFCSDSAFLYIQATSGAPEYNMLDMKFFIKIDSNKGYYVSKDSCTIEFMFYQNKLHVSKHKNCNHNLNLEGIYKRTQQVAKRNAHLLLPFTGQKGVTKLDSVQVLNAPHPRAGKLFVIYKKGAEVEIIDHMSNYYLINTGSRKNDFLWIDKKSLSLSK